MGQLREAEGREFESRLRHQLIYFKTFTAPAEEREERLAGHGDAKRSGAPRRHDGDPRRRRRQPHRRAGPHALPGGVSD
jgi:hypothetical protein